MIRLPKFAGKFYPEHARELAKMVDRFLNSTKSASIEGRLKALIVPHAGYIFSGIVAGAGYKLLQRLKQKINCVILLGPSHQVALDQPAAADFKKWMTPLGAVQTNLKVINQLKSVDISNTIHNHEHSLEVQLPFLQKVLKDFKLVPILVNQPENSLSEELIKLLKSPGCQTSLVVISSDLSHYHTYQEALALDSIANQAIPSLDTKTIAEQVEACGKGAILTLVQIARQLEWEGFFIDYKNSGDTFGDKSRVVGYGAYAFTGKK